MDGKRLPWFSIAVVLVIALLASRSRVDVGIAVAVLGVLLAIARGLIAVPVTAGVALLACGAGAIANGALTVAMILPYLGNLFILGLGAVAVSGGFNRDRREIGPWERETAHWRGDPRAGWRD